MIVSATVLMESGDAGRAINDERCYDRFSPRQCQAVHCVNELSGRVNEPLYGAATPSEGNRRDWGGRSSPPSAEVRDPVNVCIGVVTEGG